jgi:hypothetical protein
MRFLVVPLSELLALEHPGAFVARSQGRTIARDSMRELASECKSGHAEVAASH